MRFPSKPLGGDGAAAGAVQGKAALALWGCSDCSKNGWGSWQLLASSGSFCPLLNSKRLCGSPLDKALQDVLYYRQTLEQGGNEDARDKSAETEFDESSECADG
jgi:hypothetical protein